MEDGTRINLGDGVTITVGKSVDVYPITAYGYTAPEGEATCYAVTTGPVTGVVKGPWRGEDNRVGVVLLAPGRPIHKSWHWIDAAALAD